MGQIEVLIAVIAAVVLVAKYLSKKDHVTVLPDGTRFGDDGSDPVDTAWEEYASSVDGVDFNADFDAGDGLLTVYVETDEAVEHPIEVDVEEGITGYESSPYAAEIGDLIAMGCEYVDLGAVIENELSADVETGGTSLDKALAERVAMELVKVRRKALGE